MGLYLGASLVLLIAIGWLFYTSQSKQFSALTVSKMQINATNMAHIIIQNEMQNRSLKKNDIHIMNGFKYGLYDINEQVIYSQIEGKIDFTKKYYKKHSSSFYIETGALGHLGISYIVIKESSLNTEISSLLNNIIISIFLLYVVIAMIGFYLAKLFIYPIQSQREKLNNFIKNTTHELNTPLSAILLCVESENFYTEQNRKHIELSAKKMSNLYKDLTYLFFKIDRETEVPTLNLSDILNKELEYYSQLANKKNITISYHIEETFFKINEECLSRIINNLVSNAIKYTKRKGHISIRLENNILSVKDTGIGIEEEKIDKISQRYYRATDTVGGFGIGLDIVYTICKNYNIKIDVQSKINKGTHFSLNFPML